MRLAVSSPSAYDRAPPPQLFVAAQDKISPLRCPAGLSKDGAGLPALVSKPAAHQDRTAPLSCQAGLAEDGCCGPQSHVSIPAAQDKVVLLQRQTGLIEGGIRTRQAHDSKLAPQVQGCPSGLLEDCSFREPPAHGNKLSAQERLAAVPCFIGCPAEVGPAHVSRQAAVRDPAQDKKWKIGESSRSEEASSESSSIGVPEDSDDAVLSAVDGDNDEEEVQSQPGGGLGSLGSLEESLPIKRGLSNHFTGKSKSFGNLAEVSSVHQLVKPENPFNKRRRTLIACKWFTRPSSSSLSPSSFYSSPNPVSMPVLLGALNEEDDQEDGDADADTAFQDQQDRLREGNRKIVKAFRSSSCFSLSDLQQRT